LFIPWTIISPGTQASDNHIYYLLDWFTDSFTLERYFHAPNHLIHCYSQASPLLNDSRTESRGIEMLSCSLPACR